MTSKLSTLAVVTTPLKTNPSDCAPKASQHINKTKNKKKTKFIKTTTLHPQTEPISCLDLDPSLDIALRGLDLSLLRTHISSDPPTNPPLMTRQQMIMARRLPIFNFPSTLYQPPPSFPPRRIPPPPDLRHDLDLPSYDPPDDTLLAACTPTDPLDDVPVGFLVLPAPTFERLPPAFPDSEIGGSSEHTNTDNLQSKPCKYDEKNFDCPPILRPFDPQDPLQYRGWVSHCFPPVCNILPSTCDPTLPLTLPPLPPTTSPGRCPLVPLDPPDDTPVARCTTVSCSLDDALVDLLVFLAPTQSEQLNLDPPWPLDLTSHEPPVDDPLSDSPTALGTADDSPSLLSITQPMNLSPVSTPIPRLTLLSVVSISPYYSHTSLLGSRPILLS